VAKTCGPTRVIVGRAVASIFRFKTGAVTQKTVEVNVQLPRVLDARGEILTAKSSDSKVPQSSATQSPPRSPPHERRTIYVSGTACRKVVNTLPQGAGQAGPVHASVAFAANGNRPAPEQRYFAVAGIDNILPKVEFPQGTKLVVLPQVD